MNTEVHGKISCISLWLISVRELCVSRVYYVIDNNSNNL